MDRRERVCRKVGPPAGELGIRAARYRGCSFFTRGVVSTGQRRKPFWKQTVRHGCARARQKAATEGAPVPLQPSTRWRFRPIAEKATLLTKEKARIPHGKL